MADIPKLNFLMAYPYVTDVAKNLLIGPMSELPIRFLLDSGAFTAWKAGKVIALDDYCKFIETLPFKPWRYFSLDVIGDPHKTLKNYEIMLKRGFTPIPVFTRGEDPSILEDYYKTSDVVGIGGLVGTPKNKGFVKGIMTKVRGRKVHWLGFTNKDFVKVYRPYSCDSSSCSMTRQFASIELFDGKGCWIKLSKKHFIKKPPQKILDIISSYGFLAKDFSSSQSWTTSGGLSDLLSLQSHIRASVTYEKKMNVKYFLAAVAGGPQIYIPRVIKSYQKEIEYENRSHTLRRHGLGNGVGPSPSQQGPG